MSKYEGRLFIGGEFRASSDGLTFDSINPATEEVLCKVALANQADVDAAVASAAAASVEWQALDARQRGRALNLVADEIEKHGDELAHLDCVDAGKPILDCQEDIHAAAGMFRYFGGLCDKIGGETIPVQNDKFCYTRREPYGVIAAIIAWNYPLFNAAGKLAPILSTGNACVLKPAEETPLTALRLAELIQGIADIPAGLVNVINGPGEITGAALALHPLVAKLSFTGSTETGRSILRSSADSNLKGVVLELGGKSPFVIFEDAELDMALNAITFSVFYNQGQTCTAGTRLLVQESIAERVLKGLADRVGRITVGDPTSEDTHVGPLVSKVQFDRVRGFIDRALEAGATARIGGAVPEGLDTGYFVSPTVFTDVDPRSELAQSEVFGPVLTVSTFGDEEEALQLANDTSYGLASSVWTNSSQRLIRFSNGLQAGIVWANTVFAEHPGAPAGGYKESGFGREYGNSAVDEYTRMKTVWIDLSGEFFTWP
ncbi:MAG: aldehyde dehydrogenase [Aeromicrobium sp.]|nr:aldehyde dehydrogenase [Aeromicrobium sp.]